MDKNFDHQKYEEEIYSIWENSNSFTPRIIKGTKPFTIIMPPPNANDPLHIGHARFIAIQDTLIRYHRMKGVPTLWLPGSDHAGIETQFVFEKKLVKDGKSRFDYDRETLYEMIWNYVQENTKTMHVQLKKLGASCDWTRHKFTLDKDIVAVVNQTFKKLFDDGLIYRGEKIVNYCTKCGTAYSQLEVEFAEKEDNLHFLDYQGITIATTRPETIFADVAIAVNPKDERYKHLIGKMAVVPIVKREIPIIADSSVEISFGTGALKVTPAHDPLDFEIGQRHSLQMLTAIDNSGKIINAPQKYIGLRVNKAREEVVQDLTNDGTLLETKKYLHSVGTCYRCKNTIEPMVSKQWFLKVEPLVKMALKALNSSEVVFVSKQYEKIAKHWLKNLRDWNISRQIVWGIRIPAFRCKKCLEWTITQGTTPEKCHNCQNNTFEQDPDTFDTWFSSSQWPFATLMTTGENDFDYFYPTSIMETAYEIIPFWVIRMIMLGLYNTTNVPFKKVLIHGLVRDKEGLKISKSKGNVIDPLVMSEKYGTDALRMGLLWGSLIENDISLSEDNIRGQRNFANKIWNIARFVLDTKPDLQNKKSSKLNDDDKWIRSELKKTIKKTTTALEKNRLNEAAEILYEFIWKKFADVYIEKSKNNREQSQATLEFVLFTSLKLLHPFVPFVTECIWQKIDNKKEPLLINASWPK